MAGNLRKFAWNKKKLGTIGIGTLIVFIALVLVAAIASAVILKTAYSLKDTAEATGHAATSEVSGGIKIMDITGDRSMNSWGVGAAQASIERVRFVVTIWAGNYQGINIAKLRVHWLGPTKSAYLTLAPASWTTATINNFAAEEIPVKSPRTSDWSPPNTFQLQFENMIYIEIELNGANNGVSDPLAPGDHASVYFEPSAGLVVEESFTTQTTYGTNTFIDLTMQ